MKRFLFLMVILLSNCFVWAQQSLNSSAGNASSSSGSVSYSIGQVFYEANSSGGFYLNQGVQQPFEIFVLGTDHFQNIKLEIKVYPNPTTSTLFLKIEDSNLDKIEYELYDTMGRNLLKGKAFQKETALDFSQKQPGIYFLKIKSSSQLIKTFKILKK